MKKILYLLILTSIFVTYFSSDNISYAVQFDPRDTRIDLPVISIPNNAVTPRLSSDESGHVYAVWSDNRGGPSKIYINTKFVESGWSPRAVPITTGFPKATNAVQDGNATSPQVCSDKSGRVYVVWVDDRAVLSGTGKKDIYFRYSKNFGTTWNAPDEFTDYRIDSDNPAPGDSINPQIACDENGNVFIAWEDDRNLAGIFEIYFRSLQVQFSDPTDFIVPYQFPELRLNTGVEGGIYSATTPVITTNKKGVVYAAWKDSRNVPEEDVFPGIYFNISLNNGVTWKANATRIDSAPIGFYETAPPAMSNDDSGNVYIAWADTAGRAIRGDPYAGDGTYDVYFNVSHNNGATWGEDDRRINTILQEGANTGVLDTGAKDVSIASNNKGVVIVVWADNTFIISETSGKKPNFHIYSNHSENFGNTFIDFIDNVRINARKSGTESSAIRPIVKITNSGSVFVSWIDNIQTTFDIYLNFSTEKGRIRTWQDPYFWLDDAEPFGDSLNHAMTIDESGNVNIAWEDNRTTLTPDTSNIYFISGFLDLAQLLLKGQRLGEACFIATAAYGSPFERHVVLLRGFRDEYLLTNRFGRWFVETYYKLSPPAAQFIEGHPHLKPVVRVALLPFVGVAVMALKTTLLQKLLMAVSMTIVLFIAWRKLKRRSRNKFGMTGVGASG